MSFDITLGAYLAALCSTASFLPQAWKIIRLKDTGSISVGMYALTVSGFALWLVYAVATTQWALIASNAVCLVVSLFILATTCLPRRETEQVADAILKTAAYDEPHSAASLRDD